MATVIAQYVGLFAYLWLLFGSRRSPISKEVGPTTSRGRTATTTNQRPPGLQGR